jgi:eukaryotic-like serine/threonine-protein kinase
MTFATGTRFGVYEITGLIGVGGMGEVYRATDTKLGRDVAIKTLPSELANDRDRLTRFEREAKLLAALNHAHIAAIYGLHEHEATQFLAMELVEGETLERKLRDAAMPVDEALRLALQIAEALEAAHEKGVVHRDLKPANIMVTSDGAVKVLDFGLAKAFSGHPNSTIPAHSPALSLAMTQQGFILGTAGYMSPEQASGQATDQRTDIWAFGCVLYEMLTGSPLFAGESVPHILADVLRAEPDWNRLPNNLHPRLKLLLERCLEKTVRNRYHSIADARVDIEKIVADPGSAVVRGTAPAPRAAERRSAWLAAGVGLAVAIVTGAAAWLLKPAPASAPNSVVRFDFALNEGQGFGNGARDIVAVSPDGTKIVYSTNDGLYLRAVGELEGLRVPGTESRSANPFFSPDSEWIGFWDGQLKKIRTTGGPAVVLTDAGTPQGASWRPDGSTIVFGQDQGIMEVSTDGGMPTLLIPARDLWDPQYLPNGAVLFTRRTSGQRNEILVQRPNGEQHVLFPGERAIYTPTGHLITTDTAAAPTRLYARTFNLDTLEAGDPVPVAENVAVRERKTHYAIATSGALVYVRGETDANAGSGASADLLLTLVSRDGTRRPLGAPPRPYRSPRLSPDRTRVAVEIVGADNAGNSIWVHDLREDTDLRRLTQVTEGNNLRPIWTPDSERITFMSDRDGPGSIYWQNVEGRGPAEKLTTADEGTFHLPESWAPDGTLSFAVIRGGFGSQGWAMYTRSPDGKTALFYDLPNSNQWSSAFSPDGRWLAYSSGEGGNAAEDFRIFVERYPRTGERYEIAVGGALNPVWSRDGTEIFYRRGVAEGPRLLNSVTILETEPRFRFTTAGSVSIEGFLNHLNYRDFDPLPDGSGWIMLTPFASGSDRDRAVAESPKPDRINVVLNWFEELQRRAPTANSRSARH